MRINSIKLTVFIVLAMMVSGTIAGLFMKEIPVGNQEVTYMLLGSLIMGLITVAMGIFKKE